MSLSFASNAWGAMEVQGENSEDTMQNDITVLQQGHEDDVIKAVDQNDSPIFSEIPPTMTTCSMHTSIPTEFQQPPPTFASIQQPSQQPHHPSILYYPMHNPTIPQGYGQSDANSVQQQHGTYANQLMYRPFDPSVAVSTMGHNLMTMPVQALHDSPMINSTVVNHRGIPTFSTPTQAIPQYPLHSWPPVSDARGHDPFPVMNHGHLPSHMIGNAANWPLPTSDHQQQHIPRKNVNDRNIFITKGKGNRLKEKSGEGEDMFILKEGEGLRELKAQIRKRFGRAPCERLAHLYREGSMLTDKVSSSDLHDGIRLCCHYMEAKGNVGNLLPYIRHRR